MDDNKNKSAGLKSSVLTTKLGNYKWAFCEKHGRYTETVGSMGCPHCAKEINGEEINPCSEVISNSEFIHGESCPMCGAPEVEANTPRTTYACRSSDYDQRPGTFKQSDQCKTSLDGAFGLMKRYIGTTPMEFNLNSWEEMREQMKKELKDILETIKKNEIKFIETQEYFDNIH